MITVTLNDGSFRDFEHPQSILEIAKSISVSLAKKAIVGKVDGVLVDLSYIISKNVTLQIITIADQEALEVIRHSAAHLLAQAVVALYPNTKVTIGPVIENGFYYDFDSSHKFVPEDLPKIEKKMQELASANIPISRSTMSYQNAIEFFANKHENYKVEIIKDIPSTEELSLYTQGDFTDLCRGPHVASTSIIKAFKLMSIAGAYWRGDSKNPMLQRIYATAWANTEQLNEYLEMLDQAKKRDHRVLGKNLDLFHMQDEAPGMVFWHHKGYQIYQIVEQYVRSMLRNYDYMEIKTPQIVDRRLWESSGHMEMYKDLMFTTNSESREYAIKPMSCPCHVQVFNQGLKSYRDLPLRLAEFGSCHRNEPSGSLHGLMRVRGFTQDDAHIFCTIDQVLAEASSCIDLVFEMYKKFGFDNIEVRLSTRPDKRAGRESDWDMAESFLQQSLSDRKLQYVLQPKEGAFYGPKIEFALKDCLGRLWQCGTLQVDFVLPDRLGARYIGDDGMEHTPVMLHRAILGSLERFIGILIEHYAGLMPLWLSPIQMIVLNISEAQYDYSHQVYKKLIDHGFRCSHDFSNEKIGYKIRNATLQKIPYLLIIGNSELQNDTITLRACNGQDLGAMSIESYVDFIKKEVHYKHE